MTDFTKGVMWAACVIGFGKLMYELGKRKDDRTAKYLAKIIITKNDKEES